MSITVHTSAGFGESLRRLIRADQLSASTLELARRDVVYSRLDGDRCVYVVERGQVKAMAASREGKHCLLGIYTAGDVFGEACLFGGERMETVTVMSSATTVKRILSTRIVAALADVGLREEFVKYFTHRLFEQQQLITDLVTADSEYRLAATLLQLARKLGKRDAHHLLTIEERITQEELAGMVGTTRSRVGYFLKRFHHAGLVSPTKGCFLVVDEKRLDAYLAGGYRQPVGKGDRAGRAGKVRVAAY